MKVSRSRRGSAMLASGLAALALAGCERGLHQMYDQPKHKPLTPSGLFPNGNSSRPQEPGTAAHSAGALAGTSSGREGRVMPGAANPAPVTAQLIARGRERFDIYCAPCHSRAGDGDGMVARRGFPNPPSYHIERLRNAPDSHFYDAISNGFGVMYPYADRIEPHDRWAIVAYIRALQLSQHAPASALDASDLAALNARGKRK